MTAHDGTWHVSLVPPVRAFLPNRDTFSHMGLATRAGTRIEVLEPTRELWSEANGMALEWM